MSNPNAATINLAFTTFVANSNPPPTSGAPSGNYCVTSSLAFGTAGSGDTSDASGQVTISGTKITVKRNTAGNGNQPIKIKLTVFRSGDPTDYNPQAIVFVQESGSGDGNGNTNFPQANQNPNDQSILISDNMANPSAGGSPFSWHFYIQIKQMNATGPQPLGWIDPIIENESLS